MEPISKVEKACRFIDNNFIFLLALALIIVGLCGCSSASDDASNDDKKQTTPVENSTGVDSEGFGIPLNGPPVPPNSAG